MERVEGKFISTVNVNGLQQSAEHPGPHHHHVVGKEQNTYEETGSENCMKGEQRVEKGIEVNKEWGGGEVVEEGLGGNGVVDNLSRLYHGILRLRSMLNSLSVSSG